MIKKKILFHSDSSKRKTGYARNTRAVLQALFATGKYEIIEYRTAPNQWVAESDTPWKSYGCLPDAEKLQQIATGENGQENLKQVHYGSYYINELIGKEKPDVYIGANDPWGFANYTEKTWWNKIHCVQWLTLDSLPIYPPLVKNAKKIKNLWVWSDFARTAMEKLGFNHVKTVHGAFDLSEFKPIDVKARRSEVGLPEENYFFGFVFRNQLRKLVGTLFDAYKIAKAAEPKLKLLLHTSWGDKSGWDIERLVRSSGIDFEDVYTTYHCRACRNYHFSPYKGEKKACKHCGKEECYTPTPSNGPSNSHMAEIFNFMDSYVHLATSGGLEMPIVEALLCGKNVITAPYAFGEEFCNAGVAKPVKFNTYLEFGSQFLKAQPDVQDVAEKMLENARGENLQDPKVLRDWAATNFDAQAIARQIEEFVDALPPVDHSSYTIKMQSYNEDVVFDDIVGDSDEDWFCNLIKLVFHNSSPDPITKEDGIKKIKETSREHVFALAMQGVKINNDKIKLDSVDSFLLEKGEGNVAFVFPDDLRFQIPCISYVKALCQQENIVIVGDASTQEICEQIESEFRFLPKNSKTGSLSWLTTCLGDNGEKRFKEVYYISDAGTIEHVYSK